MAPLYLGSHFQYLPKLYYGALLAHIAGYAAFVTPISVIIALQFQEAQVQKLLKALGASQQSIKDLDKVNVYQLFRSFFTFFVHNHAVYGNSIT